jgi:hypothetical protein
MPQWAGSCWWVGGSSGKGGSARGSAGCLWEARVQCLLGNMAGRTDGEPLLSDIVVEDV